MWREEFVYRKWLNINEDFAYNTEIINTNITGLKLLDARTGK
jgi:hypothetical protein